MTNPAKISGPRRKLLKSITLGGGTAIAGQAMPRSWTRPVVESVVLPVHAQTSGEQASGSACPTLFIPGITFSCDSPPEDQATRYEVDDTGDCPVLNDFLPEGLVGDNQLQVQDLHVQDDVVSDEVNRAVNTGLSGGGEHGINCFMNSSFGTDGDYQGSFNALSGTPWIASYTVTEDNNVVTVSDIVLQPA